MGPGAFFPAFGCRARWGASAALEKPAHRSRTDHKNLKLPVSHWNKVAMQDSAAGPTSMTVLFPTILSILIQHASYDRVIEKSQTQTCSQTTTPLEMHIPCWATAEPQNFKRRVQSFTRRDQRRNRRKPFGRPEVVGANRGENLLLENP